MEESRIWFMLGLAATLVILVVVNFLFRPKTAAEIYAEDVGAVTHHLGEHLSLQWLLLEEVMLRFADDEILNAFFDKYPPDDVEHKRALFCMFCLRAAPDFGEIQGVMLSKEFVEANRIRIERLPTDLGCFYETDTSIRDINPEETVILVNDSKAVVLRESEETKRRRQDELIYWQDVPLPKSQFEIERELGFLLYGVQSKQVVLQFRKKPTDGIIRRRKFRFLDAFRPRLAPLGA